MSANFSNTFITKFVDEVTSVFQTEGSRIRPQVWTNNAIVGSQVRFPLLDVADVVKDRPAHSLLAGDGNAHSNVTATLHDYDSWRFIDDLAQFKTNVEYRQPYAESITQALGRSIDIVLLDAMNASNTSAGSAAGMDMALFAKVAGLAHTYKWPTTGKMTWVITPKVYAKLAVITQYGSSDYNDSKPLTKNVVRNFMGFDIVISPELAAGYAASGTEDVTFAFFNRAVGLGIGKDIAVNVGPSIAHGNSVIVHGKTSAGAVVIQPTGVLKVNVSGL
jgi:hypothetical protein